MLCPIREIFEKFLGLSVGFIPIYRYRAKPRPFLSLADRLIGPAAGHRAENDLDQLDMAGPEASGRAQKVVIPHPAEALVVTGDLSPLLIYIGMPLHQGLVVIRAKVMDIFYYDLIFNRF